MKTLIIVIKNIKTVLVTLAVIFLTAQIQQVLAFDQTMNENIPTSEKVIINGITLSKSQVAELKNIYGIQPLPGNYWYDKTSGLYGVIGFPAYGLMYAGHDFGILSRKVSNGETGVLVNGRELPQSEWFIWSQLVGSWIHPGAYWLNYNGDAGYVGSPVPTVNLYVKARQNTYSGTGGNGDNFWSSSFSAGNYDSDNQRGYVSVPGHGPVGYGFD
jgi:hypothetical protein